MASLPPTYSEETQVLIIPTPDAFQFQKGYLGANGERATIEGQVRIKSSSSAWQAVSITLQTIERDNHQSIELASSTTVLYKSDSSVPSSSSSSRLSLPSTLPFSINLPQDTPQAINSPYSSITHSLIATLTSADSREEITKSIIIYPRRYTNATDPLLSTVPYRAILDSPTRVEIQIPRTTFRVGEPVPIYVTVPPPDRTVILDGGWRLRNVKAELVRVIRLTGPRSQVVESPEPRERDSKEALNTPSEPPLQDGLAPVTLDAGVHEAVITRSGASCRFHSSRSIRVRLVLHASTSVSSQSSADGTNTPTGGFDCMITQQTILHRIDFHLSIDITFLNSLTHSEHIGNLVIPITLLPPAAPDTSSEMDLEAMYRKKHDKPPAKTNRKDDPEIDEAGSSSLMGHPNQEPPPFDDRDAPPPFFVSDPQAVGGSSHLPTFLESENEARFIVANNGAAGPSGTSFEDDMPSSFSPSSDTPLSIPGEGTLFGFGPAEQYDGLSLSFGMSTPPPGVASSIQDTDITALADLIDQPERALEALESALDAPTLEPSLQVDGARLPPPPPLLDDPEDPPPSIDSADYHSLPPRLDGQAPLGANSDSLVSDDPQDPPPSIDVDYRIRGQVTPPRTGEGQLTLQTSSLPLSNPHPEIGGPPPYLVPPTESQSPSSGVRPPPYADHVLEGT